MNWKNLLLLLPFPALLISCSSNNSEKSEEKQTAPYTFNAPEKWATEQIPFPISFAPNIPYSGVEEARFAPGWASLSNEEHWTYTFLWWLEGKPSIDSAALQKNLTEYYSGLLAPNLAAKSIPAGLPTEPVVKIEKIETAAGDAETFSGTIMMLDYLDPGIKLITLNSIIHKKFCDTHTALIFLLSPQPTEHNVWRQLDQLNTRFECSMN